MAAKAEADTGPKQHVLPRGRIRPGVIASAVATKSTIEIRAASVSAVDFINAAHAVPHARANVHRPREDEVRAAPGRPDLATLIIERDGNAAGMYLLGYFGEPSPWLVELRRIIVTQPGSGIGTAAMRWVIDHAFTKAGAHRIWLDVLESNRRARRLHQRAGFRYEGTYRDGFREDDVRLRLCGPGSVEPLELS